MSCADIQGSAASGHDHLSSAVYTLNQKSPRSSGWPFGSKAACPSGSDHEAMLLPAQFYSHCMMTVLNYLCQ
jgi:hypothetical protein